MAPFVDDCERRQPRTTQLRGARASVTGVEAEAVRAFAVTEDDSFLSQPPYAFCAGGLFIH